MLLMMIGISNAQVNKAVIKNNRLPKSAIMETPIAFKFVRTEVVLTYFALYAAMQIIKSK